MEAGRKRNATLGQGPSKAAILWVSSRQADLARPEPAELRQEAILGAYLRADLSPLSRVAASEIARACEIES